MQTSSSIDGNVSCCADWQRVHHLREQYDAIAVGGRTWNIDHPRLTARAERLGREPKRQPVRVIFAGSQPCAIQPAAVQTFVIGNGAPFQGCGHASDLVSLPMQGHDLRQPLQALYGHGIRSLLVEGGRTLLHSFFRQGFADVVTVFVRTSSVERAVHLAREELGFTLEDLRVSPFGEGFLLEAGHAHACGLAQGLEQAS
ncbi:RibD family protein [Rhizobium oryziradicis]|uniref:RibD family protein n=1 Tax=Rhizobium oryziradicis TaxID=1867956 RepID=UPI0015880FC7|nr:dihydrofolate reductase family protein [Rhizobium oryziradicis]